MTIFQEAEDHRNDHTALTERDQGMEELQRSVEEHLARLYAVAEGVHLERDLAAADVADDEAHEESLRQRLGHRVMAIGIAIAADGKQARQAP